MRFPSGKGIELDVFVNDIHLALEYQGEQHYRNIYPFGELKVISERDKHKREACKKVKICFFSLNNRLGSHWLQFLIGGI